ncbi:uncharacterized protein LOC131859171 [Cryptomeria japonica]|uniref:uncharacterized protein LOC131859171 n=1 Tax=Cryptomeria japonica TaxID=3369 RepID=UPI0027D9F581|nr:uncharacterized protein LOC131859171 [Cryptomeria japonica]
MTIENDEATTNSEIEENEAIKRNNTEYEWEIISRLHHGQNIQFLEIDMLGRRDIDRHTDWFADYQGVSMILVGDLGQLPPVNDKPTYTSNRREKLLWEEFKIVVTLDKIFRQDGENIQQQIFRQLLTNLRDANPQIDDWKLLATKAGSVNVAEDCSTDEFDLELLISKNARVMLTSNLWIQVGLVNGALGYVQKIVYKTGSAPPNLLTYVMVDFDNYLGLPFEDHHPNTIPIIAIQKGRTLQLPLRLAWALTIHKSQGLTLPKTTIDIGPRERTGLIFVAVSRVNS